MEVKIGIDARLLYYQRGGIAQYTRHLIHELLQLDRVSESYFVLASRKDADQAAHLVPGDPGARWVKLWTPPHHRFEQLALPIELARLRLDLLHSPDFIPPFSGRFRRVITVHDLNFLLYPEFLTAESRRYYNAQIKRAVAVADHILADSHATRDDLVRLLGVPDEKISVVWLAAKAVYRRLPPDTVQEQLARHRLTPGYVLFSGTLEPRKNLPGLLQAYHSLLARLPDIPPLLIAGRRGWLYDGIWAQVERLELAKRVRFVENPEDEELAALYNGAGVLVLPSFYEGFGLTVLEAMACGVPVIAANRASLPEIAGGAALLVEPEDTGALAEALEQVLTGPALRARLIEAGQLQAARFSWTTTAQQTLAVYRQVLAGV
ncbi:MAG: glycosyltransferase family 4 protein [Thermoflexales bacterium]|nr:glycosyltransferase family 4 protein [Thermoflexales bacterium]